MLVVCLTVSLSLGLIRSWGFAEEQAARGGVLVRGSTGSSIQVRWSQIPWIRLRDGVDVSAMYVGSTASEVLLKHALAEPLALASGDFDEDGVADLVSSYAGPSGGLLTLHRGNIESLWTRGQGPSPLSATSTELQRTTDEGPLTRGWPSPFMAEARVFSLRQPPDFMQTGDFDGDGHTDVLTAAREADALLLLAGDGKGGFAEPRRIEVPGNVTALTSGELGRADGLSDVAVGVTSERGSQVMVFTSPQGALRAGAGNPLVTELPAQVSALAVNYLDKDYFADLVVAAGSDLLLVQGQDQAISDFRFQISDSSAPTARVITRLSFPSAIRSLVVGDFVSDRDHRNEIALLTEDGRVQVVGIRGSGFGVRDSDGNGRAGPSVVSKDVFRLSAEANTTPRLSAPRLVRAQVSSLQTDELVVVDPATHRIHILFEAPTPNPESRTANAIALEATSEPVAVLPMRLNADALSDLVILRRGEPTPSVVMTTAAQSFVVTSAANTGPGTLRQAINDANNNPGPDEITFNLPGNGQRTLSPTSALPIITEAITIDGTTQPGGRLELSGATAGLAVNGLVITGGRSVVRGMVINRFSVNLLRILSGDLLGAGGNGIVVASPNNIIEGNFLGTDFNGVGSAGNGLSGVLVTGVNNTIGGTLDRARNILSANLVGVGIATAGGTGNVIQGNHIGTDVNGSASLANSGGVVILGASNNTIGGTAAGARNVISGNTKTPPVPDLNLSGGLVIANFNNFVGASTNLAQGNFIGLDRTGTRPLGNGNPGAGVFISDSANNTIGGRTAAARNIISANTGDGIVIGGSRANGNIVQGNLIGALSSEASGAGLRNSGHGVLITQTASTNLVGGTSSEAANTIGFNGGDGVFIDSGTGNAVLMNSIFSNGGLGIDLDADGVTANDAGDGDAGANNQQNYPVLTGAFTSPGRTSVVGTLNSQAAVSFKVQFFVNDSCDPSGFGEGQGFLNEQSVTTDANGNARISLVLPTELTVGRFVTATATDPNNNTSEFSRCVRVEQQGTDLSVTKTGAPDPVIVGRNVTYTITVINDSLVLATGVVLTDVLPSTVTFVSVSATQGACSGTTTVTCNLGAMIGSATATVTIIVRTTTRGMISNTVSVRGDQPDPDMSNNSATQTTTVQTGPDIDVTPAVLDFGRVPVRQTRDLSLTVRNTGDALLTVSRLTINNLQFVVVSPVGAFTVEAGGQQQVTLRFAPSLVAPQTADLTISSDDPDETTISVQLRAEGIPDAPVIQLTPESLDFGAVPVGDSKDLTLRVQNIGTVTLTITNVVISNVQFSYVAPPVPVNVLSGASQNLTFRFQPRGEGVQIGTISLTSNDPSRPVASVQLRGEGAALRARFEVTPTSLDFGRVTVGQSTDLTLTLRNTGTAGLTVSNATANNPQFAVTGPPLPITLRDGAEVRMGVRFRPTAAGAQTADLTITSTAPNQPIVIVPLRGEGLAQPEIDVTPLTLDFGRVGLRQSRELTFAVRNIGSGPLQVTGLTSSNPQFAVVSPAVPFTVAAGAQQQVTVRFTPTTIAVQTGSLTVASNDSDEPTVTVALRGEGIGIPMIAVTPRSLDFGRVIRGESKELSLTLENTGSATLTVTRIASSNAQFSATSPSVPVSLDPGSRRTVTVVYRPTTVAQHTAVLTIESNDATTPSVTVDLRGEGVAAIPKIEVAPASIDFGTIQIGQTADRTVTIRSVGNVPLTVTSIRLANPQFSLVAPTVPFSLNPGGQQQLTVGFRPTAAGSPADTLIITSNDPDVGTARVSITGQAVIPPPIEVTLSAPSNVVGFSGGTVSVPISLGDGGMVSALRFTLTYDPAMLSVPDAQAVSRGDLVPQNFAMSVNLGTRGQVTILIAPPLQTPVPSLRSGSGTVAIIVFRIANSVQDGATAMLHFDTASASDSSARSVILNKRDGAIVIQNSLVGDVNLDGQVNEQDLIRFIQHLTGESTLTGRGLQAADMNCDGQVNEQDLIRLIQHLTGERPLPQRCQPQAAKHETIEMSRQRFVSLGAIPLGLEQAAIPILIDDGAGIAAMGLRLVYDASAIEVLNVARGDLVVDGFKVYDASTSPGVMNFLLVPPLKAPLPTFRTGPGSVLTVLVRLRNPGEGQGLQGLRIEAARLSDNQAGEIKSRLF